jgi:hypothetical protein
MIRKLFKRTGKVNPQFKELNKLIWEYVELRESIIQEAVRREIPTEILDLIDDNTTGNELELGIGLVTNDSIEEKIRKHGIGVAKLQGTLRFMSTYGLKAKAQA